MHFKSFNACLRTGNSSATVVGRLIGTKAHVAKIGFSKNTRQPETAKKEEEALSKMKD